MKTIIIFVQARLAPLEEGFDVVKGATESIEGDRRMWEESI